jgi:hypothetical protein
VLLRLHVGLFSREPSGGDDREQPRSAKGGVMVKKKGAGAKSRATKKAVKKKPVAKPAPAKKRTTKKPAKKGPVVKAARKKSTAKARTSGRKAVSLGRPRITGDARLEQFFHKDYEARQVFDFLRVTTVKELEQFPPEEIIERLTAPVIRTVNRIRKALALNNRCLANDRDFAVEFKKQFAAGR